MDHGSDSENKEWPRLSWKAREFETRDGKSSGDPGYPSISLIYYINQAERLFSGTAANRTS
jgi:hypothetical protein